MTDLDLTEAVHSKGGATVLGNLQVTHSRCNLIKGARV